MSFTILTTPVTIATGSFTINVWNTRDVSLDHAPFSGADWGVFEIINDTSSQNGNMRSSDSDDDRGTHDVDNDQRCFVFRHVGTGGNDDSLDFYGADFTDISYNLVAFGTTICRARADGLVLGETVDAWHTTAITAIGGASIAGGLVDITGPSSNDTIGLRRTGDSFNRPEIGNQNCGTFHAGVNGSDQVDFYNSDLANKSAFDHGHTTNDDSDGDWTYYEPINREADLTSTDTYQDLTVPHADATIAAYVLLDDAGTFQCQVVNGDGTYVPTTFLNCAKRYKSQPFVPLDTDGGVQARANVISGTPGPGLFEICYFIPAAGGPTGKKTQTLTGVGL